MVQRAHKLHANIHKHTYTPIIQNDIHINTCTETHTYMQTHTHTHTHPRHTYTHTQLHEDTNTYSWVGMGRTRSLNPERPGSVNYKAPQWDQGAELKRL